MTATARQLDATGRAQATSVGEAIATRAIPFTRVVSSELQMGDAAVFKPAPPGPPRFIAQLTPAQWVSLAP